MSESNDTAIDAELDKLIRSADEESRRRGRIALRRMVRTGQVFERDLTNVAAISREMRKSIKHLTITDLIGMGIVTVVNDGMGGAK